MSRRAVAPVAWGLWLAAVAAVAVAALLSARYPFSSIQEIHDPVGEAVWAASWLGFGLVGALILTRRPDNRIGWLLSGITLTLAIGVVAPGYARVAFQNPGAGLPLGALATWVAMWVITLTFGGVVALLLLFPSGQLQARRQQAMAAALAAVVALNVVVEAISPGAPEGDAPPFNPLGVTRLDERLEAASGLVGGLFGAVAAVILADFVYRFWRSRGVERLQFRWMVWAAAAFPVLFIVGVGIEESYLDPNSFDPVVLAFFLCGNGLAAAIGVAITRHGLYEINRVVSRSVGYLLLTAVLAAVYVAAVTVLTAATAPLTQDAPVAVAAATLVAAAVFGPARRRIQGAVDRRFNRARYDAVRTVDAYRGRLRDQVDLEAVVADLVDTVAASMQPAVSTLWLAGAATGAEKILPQATAVTVSERHREKKVT